MNMLTHFAAETAATDAGLFGALGIDWRLLILQIIAFLILVFLLGKFVYPWLMKQVDERAAAIEKAAEAATAAEKAAADTKEQVAELLDKAREEAAEIVETAQLEAAELMAITEKKAKAAAERIAADAAAQLEKDVARAKATLFDETLQLVALTTEKLVGTELTAKIDENKIRKTLREHS